MLHQGKIHFFLASSTLKAANVLLGKSRHLPNTLATYGDTYYFWLTRPDKTKVSKAFSLVS